MLNFLSSLTEATHETVSPVSVAETHRGSRYYRFQFLDFLRLDI